MIPLKDCKHGFVYRIHSRNLVIGVFNAETKGFVGIRKKFRDEYLFTEYHHDTGAPHGTVRPEAEIGKCPITDLREDLGTICWTCKKPIEYKNDPTAAPYPGRWTHLKPGKCKDEMSACTKSNTALFKYLKDLKDHESAER